MDWYGFISVEQSHLYMYMTTDIPNFTSYTGITRCAN